MQNEWLLDVIADLKTFAGENGMEQLARHLEETREIVLTEMSSSRGEAPVALPMDEKRTGADT
ncbi:MAG: hypothetical protein QUV10_06720 [Paracoccaceae bacterium]|jgi:hypothetical protein|uniref:hypothetical protein n=1 Tax=unclassified Seohaeicola TaxID=2641111 RepID=UPI00237B02D1|nr:MULTISPECIES: hypothetical protein [unclassified Seohaeicola]MDD9706441.1 hypothetical protein [Seohaeicola sp. 4SK31]MDD9733932.1 hypothetical protein [Seohaeicola sp. SP36]MDF1709107.1 hypothetical protein [Paracoccaceae bacterium]MDM7969296.1 hypothetical protein [Paracoccaceae bacterium]